ncbi:MAG TPA: FAD/NAD(P)-binding oxidoreductase [Leucothrix sp.]|nr:FAD/NAD(P)-binding oxidoreductase [Leucothrix sp.]
MKTKLTNSSLDIADVDIAIIGGGIVGCAVARRMTLEGASVILVEKSTDILAGASKGNSAILHTGFDAPENSLEHECIQNGYQEYLEIHKDMNLPLLKTGALLVAWTAKEKEQFSSIIEKAQKNGVDDLRLLSANELHQLEPSLAKTALAAIEVPREFVIDPWSAPLAYLLQAVENGCQTLFNAEVISGEFDGNKWTLHTNNGDIKAGHVINSAGLYGDILDKNVLGDTEFIIKPRKGEFVVFDKAAHALVKNIILPIPTEITKGVVIFPTIFGNLAVGPTADEQEERDDASVDKANLEMLHQLAIEKIPALKNIPVTATYAGIRPATEKKEYRIRHVTEKNWITLGGIRSTGLTAALGIAQHVQKLFTEQNQVYKKLAEPLVKAVPNLAEHLPRDWQSSGYDEIVCHCEMATKREILATFNSTIPPGSLAGLKRRTRVTMGRCQGFYCSARLSELTEGKFIEPISVGETDD